MESSIQLSSQSSHLPVNMTREQTDSSSRSLSGAKHMADLLTLRHEMEYLNTIGKRFVAAFDRFQVHRALLLALQELYSFSACCVLLKSETFELFIIPCYPLNTDFLEAMIQRITSAASALNLLHTTPEKLARNAYLDAPDELAQTRTTTTGSEIGSCLNIPLTVENRIIGMLSLFDEKKGTFDTNLLQMTTMIADYAAVALENVRLRERENALWQRTELQRMHLELIIGSMTEGLLITDAKGNITRLNKSAEQLLSQAKIEISSSKSLRRLAKNSNIPWLTRLMEIINQAQAGSIVKNQQINAGQLSDRVPLTLSISAAPLYDTGDTTRRPTGVVTVLNDITSSKQVERLKDEFVSIVSHELRTPLTAIKGYTQHLVRRVERRLRKAQAALTQQGGSPEDLPEQYDLRNLTIVQSQTEHLERLVNDLLDLSRVQWGQLELYYSTFYLADLLAESVRSVQASAEQHTIKLEIKTTTTKIVADRARISQVVGNILDNAVKYSPYGGEVTVSLEKLCNNYTVSIRDEGMGISPDQFEHIFERFYRIRNPASQQLSGIGLGLYVTKAIVDQHGGRIWLTNNEDSGTTFYFTLPEVSKASVSRYANVETEQA